MNCGKWFDRASRAPFMNRGKTTEAPWKRSASGLRRSKRGCLRLRVKIRKTYQRELTRSKGRLLVCKSDCAI
jgi:hypothetical protein